MTASRRRDGARNLEEAYRSHGLEMYSGTRRCALPVTVTENAVKGVIPSTGQSPTLTTNRRAGYRARGHAAEVNASRLRRRPDVTAAIEAALAAANEPALRTQALLLARFEVGRR